MFDSEDEGVVLTAHGVGHHVDLEVRHSAQTSSERHDEDFDEYYLWKDLGVVVAGHVYIMVVADKFAPDVRWSSRHMEL